MAPTKRSTKSNHTPLTGNIDDKTADIQASSMAKVDRVAQVASDTGSKLPCAAHFPLTVALSFALSTLGSVVMSQVSLGELQSLTRSPDTWSEVALLTSWRIAELALAWFGELDCFEAASMNILAHGPVIFLLTTFYGLSLSSAVSALVIDVLSIAASFYLVLPLSRGDGSAWRGSNRDVLDIPMQILTSILSTAIYTVTLVLSLRFLLPRILVLYFSGLPTLEPAYSASYTHVFPVTLLFGLAASTFIFAPFATTGKSKEDVKVEQFDPVNASLGQTVWWNFWGYTAKTKVVIRRTVTAAVLTGVSTFIACTQNIYGVESSGAAAYAGVWATSAILAGVGLGFVGGE
ncbi:hypothetical protein EsDP_00000262 [Epichloe bromicola]|uniref:Uncharacterized protein n=1 Tax=Epichloe bromicola TaxID=79588 RepID=A0ABQ0CEE0_9HYPO